MNITRWWDQVGALQQWLDDNLPSTADHEQTAKDLLAWLKEQGWLKEEEK